MTVRNKTALKGYFEAGDVPTESNFADLIDSISPWTATFTVAANAASANAKAQADYLCDGTDDDVQIQAAIDALPAAGGKVLLSEGSFNISSPIQMSSFSTLQGQGFGTLISAMATLDDNMIELKSVNVEQVVLDNFRMFGLAGQQDAGHGIYFDNSDGSWTVKEPDHYITNLMISFIKQCGVYLKSSTGGNNSSRIVDVFAFSCRADGFYIDGPDIRLHGCDAGASGERGFNLKGGACMLSVCKAFYSGSITVANGQGFLISSSRTQMFACQAQDNYSHGFETATGANRILFVGCQADSNGRDASKANGFQFTAGVRFQLSGCAALDVATGDDQGQDYGVQIDSGMDYIYIDSSYTDGNITGGLNNDSAGANIDTAGLKEW